MSTLSQTMIAIVAVLAATAAFFFVCTRGALIVRGLTSGTTDSSHVYPIYSNMGLIKLVDWQPIIAAILLFQYHRLVSRIVAGLRATDLRGKTVLITSCAFGNVIPRVAEAAFASGAKKVVIADIIRNELDHARGKLAQYGDRVEYVEQNATAMAQPEGFADANINIFLLHELPHNLTGRAIDEAGRMLAPGGKRYLAEFHRPQPLLLRLLSWSYFKVFEPLGLALWDTHDPLPYLCSTGDWKWAQRETCFHGNFQAVEATKA